MTAANLTNALGEATRRLAAALAADADGALELLVEYMRVNMAWVNLDADVTEPDKREVRLYGSELDTNIFLTDAQVARLRSLSIISFDGEIEDVYDLPCGGLFLNTDHRMMEILIDPEEAEIAAWAAGE